MADQSQSKGREPAGQQSAILRPISIAAYFTMVGGLLGLLAAHSLFSRAVPVIAVQIAAVILLLWARITFGRRSFHAAANPTEGGLVTSGPYRFIRHPIYTAVCLFATAGAAAHLSWQAVLCASFVWTGAVARMLFEEHLLVQRYPEYKAYSSRTARIVPFVF